MDLPGIFKGTWLSTVWEKVWIGHTAQLPCTQPGFSWWGRGGHGMTPSSVSSLHPGPLYCADASGRDAGCTPARDWEDVGLSHRSHKDPVGSRTICSPATSTHGHHRRERPQADLNTGTTKKKPCKSQLLNALKSAKCPKTGMQDAGSGCEVSLQMRSSANAPSVCYGGSRCFWGPFSLAWIKFNLKMHKASLTAKQSLREKWNNNNKKQVKNTKPTPLPLWPPQLNLLPTFSAIYVTVTHNHNLLVHSLTKLEYLFNKLN